MHAQAYIRAHTHTHTQYIHTHVGVYTHKHTGAHTLKHTHKYGTYMHFLHISQPGIHNGVQRQPISSQHIQCYMVDMTRTKKAPMMLPTDALALHTPNITP